jgi:hypothetical protein
LWMIFNNFFRKCSINPTLSNLLNCRIDYVVL